MVLGGSWWVFFGSWRFLMVVSGSWWFLLVPGGFRRDSVSPVCGIFSINGWTGGNWKIWSLAKKSSFVPSAGAKSWDA